MATNKEKDEQRKTNSIEENLGNQDLPDTGAEKLIVNRRLLLHYQHRTAGTTN
jgi:hypothetical protein